METQLTIDNKARTATNGAVAERRSPITGKIVTRFAAANVDDALAAADSAAAAFATWSKSARGGMQVNSKLKIVLGATVLLRTYGPTVARLWGQGATATILGTVADEHRTPEARCCYHCPPPMGLW